MNSFLLFVAGLLVLALSALFAAPYFIDWNDYRDVFEAQATKLIGRSVDVGGAVSLTLLPAPVLKFETVNVADPEGSFDTPFASARSVTVWLSVPPLLSGTVEARSIEVVQPIVNLRINEDGTGNWTDLGGEAASLAFIPTDVALNSVEIDKATVNIWRGKPEPDTVLEEVGGELSSRGLQGPYRFNGQFSLAGKERELRFSTGKPDEEGEFRLTVGVRSPETRDSFQFDGAVRGLQRVPVFKGTLKARLADKTDAATLDDTTDNKDREAAPFEITSELFAGLTGAEFENFELTINRKAKPQLIRGLMTTKFERGLVLNGSFSSRWVDLDSWYGNEKPEERNLGSALAVLGNELLSRSAAIREGNIRLLLDQVVLGGDLTTNFRSTVNVGDSQIEFAELSARLPGDNRLKLNGKLSSGEGGASFDGPILLHGESLPRLLRWAGLKTDSSLVAQKDDFAVSGQLNTSGNKFSLADLEGNLFGSAFKGNLNYESDTENILSLKLESDKLDLARLLGAKATAPALVGLFGRPSDQGEKGAEGGLSDWLSKTRTEADINVASATFAGLGDTAVELDVSIDKASVDIKRLSFASGNDVAIQAGGRLRGLDAKPQGNITLAVQANNGPGVVAIGSFLELPILAGRSPERVAALTPIQLTAAVKSSPAEAGGLDVQLEGVMGKSDVALKMNLTGNLAAWREASVDMQANVSNASGIELLQQLRPGLDGISANAFSGGPGKLTVDAEGVPKTGLSEKIVLSAGGTDITIQGKQSFAEVSGKFDGSVSFNAASTRAGLALLGVRVPDSHGTDPMQGSGDVNWANSVYELKGVKGEIGGTAFEADLTADRSGEKPRMTVAVRSTDVSLAKLFAPVLAWNDQQADEQQIRGVTDPGVLWPKVPFNTSFMNSFDGFLSVQANTMRVFDRFALTGASLKAKLSDGRLAVTALEGTAHGGKVNLSGVLEAQGSGAVFELKGSGSGFSLDEVSKTASGDPLIRAPADFEISLRGEGLTPLGLVSGLSGTGQLTILDGDINGFSLGAAHAAAIAAQKEKSSGGSDEAALGKRVTDELGASSMAFSQIKAPFSVNNGIVEFDKIALSDAEGRVIIATFLQLANMQLDSEWALQSATAIEGTKPRVSLVFSGPLADVGKIRPEVDTAGLARFVTIRQMQKDVERLEKLDVSGKAQDRAPASPGSDAPPPFAQNTADNTPPTASVPPPGPVPPLPERKRVEKKPEQKTPEPKQPDVAQSGTPPPVQPVIPGQDASPPPGSVAAPAASPEPTASAARPVAPEPSRKPEAPAAAAAPRPPVATAPGPDRKPPAPPPVAAPVPSPPPAESVAAAPAAETARRPAPLPVRKPPVPRIPVAAPSTAPSRPPPSQSSPAPLPWQQTTTPAPAPNQAATDSQAPTQLPTPATTQDAAPATPPPAPRPRFDPFAPGNTAE